jgi:hypothetical protein
MYYAEEGIDSGYKQDHPLCDLYFLTEGNQLVVIDVTGFNDEDFKNKTPNKLPVKKRRIRMIAWIKQHMEEYNNCSVTLHGVVLAPFDTGNSELKMYGDNSLQIRRGTDAVDHPGGLSQLLFWYASTNRVEDEDEDE